ncbi:MAG: hypothetical protein RRY54_00120 [Angelakisella sp.]
MAGVLDKLNTLVGNPQKALLVLHYTPTLASEKAAGVKTDKFGFTVVATANKLETDGLATHIKDESNRSDYVMEVQYNPSSISMTASAESMPIRPLLPAFDPNVPLSASVPPSVIMMIELIFDDIVVPDAFMFDKFNISAGNIVNDVLLATDTTAHTVQPQTNALLAAMQRKNTREVTLYWADMCFHGIIRDMQAKYTMFSVSGRPIRSVMNFTIVQNSSNEDGDSANEYWKESMESVFGVDPEGVAPVDKTYSARTKAQELGTWLNFF